MSDLESERTPLSQLPADEAMALIMEVRRRRRIPFLTPAKQRRKDELMANATMGQLQKLVDQFGSESDKRKSAEVRGEKP